MKLFHLLISLALLISSSQVHARTDNPFDKAVIISAGNDVTWKFGEQSATKSVKGSDGTWYHLFYDGLRLRIRLTGSAADSSSGAKQFDEFAVYDVKVDGKRLDVFQWCLNNQDRHSRFLQQGLSVKKGVCQNQGEQGAFVMRLTKETIADLNRGNEIEYKIKPFRTTIQVKFNIDDFDKAVSQFKKQHDAKLAASKPKAPVKAAPVVVAAPKPKPKSKAKCKVGPPEGFAEVKAISYNCDDAKARNKAKTSVDAKVNKIREQRKKVAAEAERKRKQEEAARLAKEEQKLKEQEALAASAAIQAELSSDIAKKMIAVCEKKWATGEHRCYCQKYIQFAPASIQANSSCK
jgi:hypothetical protein